MTEKHSDDRDDDRDDAMPPSVAAAVAQLRPAPAPSPATISHVMQAVRRRRTAHTARRWGTTAAAIAAATVLWIASSRPGLRRADTPHYAPTPIASVHFQVAMPAAHDVYVVGDFNGWNARAMPMTRDETTGAWATSVALPEGRYLYAFVADGRRWIADPNAPLAAADDFARQNSVLIVAVRTSKPVLQ